MKKINRTKKPAIAQQDFYEVMPMAGSMPFTHEHEPYDADGSTAKMTAIVTLVILGVVTAGLAALVIYAVQTVAQAV